MANSRKSPHDAAHQQNGINTAISEVLIERTVKPISRRPCRAASYGGMPFFQIAGDVFDDDDGVVHHEASGNRQRHQRRLSTCSRTGTSRRRCPSAKRHGHAGMSVAQTSRRKTKTTSTTRRIEINRRISTSWTEARMVTVRSSAMSSESGRNRRLQLRQQALMRSTVSMMFAPGWREDDQQDRRLAVRKPALRMFSTESRTFATSESGPAPRCGKRRSAAHIPWPFIAGHWSQLPSDVASGKHRPWLHWRWRLEACARVEADAIVLSCVGFARCARRAASCPRPIPGRRLRTCEIFCARSVEPASYIWPWRSIVRRHRNDHDRRVGRIDLAIGGIAGRLAGNWPRRH